MAEEYRALRAELTARIEKQQDITNFTIALIVAFVAVIRVTQPSSFAQGAASLWHIFPFFSLVLSAFILMALDHEMNIAHISLYIHERLRKDASSVMSGAEYKPWGWNAYRSREQQHAGIWNIFTLSMASAKYGMTILANIFLLGAYWRHPDGRMLWVDWAAYLLALFVLLWVIGAAIFTSRIYLKMPHEDAE
ncbi:hypothetical protein OHA74_23285 [Streptomyces phaeochromogenes]|uniref:hypothetical protein n=1 Tax=Streptomyces phaeochromogenes TaxID=1923 RepID=UPI002DD8C5C1|nr:hypothetical protein [Streptomyces phaeochromogenes]WRZ29375.1 hypothetical protein OG931_17240 [Streptomyces phaeochromogenes]